MRTALKGVLAGSTAVAAASVAALMLLSPAEIHTIDHVVDGDTIVVHDQHGESLQVQLLNVDAPELDSEIPFETCHAQQTKEYLESELPAGTQVQLRTDDETDAQGRMLALVSRTDNQTSVNELVVAKGHGLAVQTGKNTDWFEVVAKQGAEAEAAHRGLHDPELPCTPAAAVAEINNDVQSYSPTDVGSMSDAQLTTLISAADGWLNGLDAIRNLPTDSLARRMADLVPADEFNRLQIRAQTIRTRASDEQGKRIKEAARAAEQAHVGD